MTDRRTTDETWLTRRDALRRTVCQGDLSALEFLSIMMDAVEVWDDLYDGDKPVPRHVLQRTFVNLLFWLPQNQFFRAHQGYLLPIIMTCVNAWLDANDLEEEGSRESLTSAWYLKQFGIELYPAIAFLKGGFGLARQVGPEVRELLRHEPLEDYLKEHSNA